MSLERATRGLGDGIGVGCRESAAGGMSLKRAKRARKAFVEGIGGGRGQWPKSFMVPLNIRPYYGPCTSVLDVPSPTISVPMFNLDY